MTRSEIVLTYLNLVLTACLLAKLWRAGLLSPYRLFATYLGFDLLATLIPLFVPTSTDAYAYFYFAAQTAKIVVAAFVLREIYGRSLEQTPALSGLVKRSIAYILGSAMLFPIAALFWEKGAGRFPILEGYFLFEQTVGGTIVFFVAFLSIFLAYFPVKLKRNVFVYTSGFIAWALIHAVTVYLSAQNLKSGAAMDRLNLTQFVLQGLCLMYWLVAFRTDGESRTAVVGHLWSRAEAERLSRQIEEINASLERMRRR